MIAVEISLLELGAALTAVTALFGAVMGGISQYRAIKADKIKQESERAAHTADAVAVGLTYLQAALDTLQEQHEGDQREIKELRRQVNRERHQSVERDAKVSARVAALEADVRTCHEERDQLRRRIAELE